MEIFLLFVVPSIAGVTMVSVFLWKTREKAAGSLLVSMITTIGIFYGVVYVLCAFVVLVDDFSVRTIMDILNPVNLTSPYGLGGLLTANSWGFIIALLITKYAWDRRKLKGTQI